MAFLARLNPLAVIVAGLVVALAELGGDTAQISMAIPKVVTGIFKGILLFMLLAGGNADTLSTGMGRPRRPDPQQRASGIMIDELLLTVLLTSVPLILAATGELVAEKSGV